MSLKHFAVLLSALTFVLLLVGGLVHGTGSGLACPDWPLCFGSALPKMTGHVLYEHSHRLVAGSVAVLTTVLAIAISVRRRSDGALVRLAWFAVALVIVQALLGALTVWLKLPAIVSSAHLGVSMLFFCTTIYLAWRLAPGQATPLAPPQRRWIALALGFTYAQIVLGAVVRHTGSGLACVDFPLCQGSLLPLGAHPSVILQATHRLFAVLVAIVVIFASVGPLRATGGARGLVRLLGLAAPLLVAVQVTLGALSVLSFLELSRVTAHLGVAALLLATLLVLYLRTTPATPTTATAASGSGA